MTIIRNAAQCSECLSIIESKHVHDFASCYCGCIFVDGGLEYIRSGAKHMEHFISLVEYDNE